MYLFTLAEIAAVLKAESKPIPAAITGWLPNDQEGRKVAMFYSMAMSGAITITPPTDAIVRDQPALAEAYSAYQHTRNSHAITAPTLCWLDKMYEFGMYSRVINTWEEYAYRGFATTMQSVFIGDVRPEGLIGNAGYDPRAVQFIISLRDKLLGGGVHIPTIESVCSGTAVKGEGLDMHTLVYKPVEQESFFDMHLRRNQNPFGSFE